MNRIFKRAGIILLAGLFILLIVEIVVISPQGLNEKSKIAATSEIYNNEQVKQLMEGVHVIETKNEEKEWELWAEKAIGLREADELALNRVKAIFFGNDGVQLVVTGDRGEVEPRTKDMTIEGQVVTRSSNGYVFRTETVSYNSESRMISSPTHVEVTGPKDGSGRAISLSGESMEADLNRGVMAIKDQVRASKPVNGDRMTVRSDKVELNGKDHGLRFIGKVTIDMNGLRVTGPDALFKYDNKSDLLKSIEVAGGVRVSDIDKWATSDKLNIFLDEDKYVFNGNPRVVQDNDELRGDQIVFLNGGKKVQVKNAKVKVSRERLERTN